MQEVFGLSEARENGCCSNKKLPCLGSWGSWKLYFRGSWVGWVPQGAGLHRWERAPWAQCCCRLLPCCCPCAVAFLWGCVCTAAGTCWKGVVGWEKRQGCGSMDWLKREGSTAYLLLAVQTQFTLCLHMKGITLGLSQHVPFLHRAG